VQFLEQQLGLVFVFGQVTLFIVHGSSQRETVNDTSQQGAPDHLKIQRVKLSSYKVSLSYLYGQ
jgi:hypothetical protein